VTGLGDAVLLSDRSAPGLHGSWYWNVPVAVAVQAVRDDVTTTSAGETDVDQVPAAVPPGRPAVARCPEP
jgi:hypothetical protein